MKNLLLILMTLFIISCDTSDGKKFGVLQKVSHKKFPCNYHVCEIAYQGGRVSHGENGSAYLNSQEIEISATCADTLSNYVGETVVFDYENRSFTICAPKPWLTEIKIKK